jgi:hypothetical protein
MMLLDVLIVCKTRSVYRDRSCGVSPVPKSEGSPPHGLRPVHGDPGPGAPAVWFFGVETKATRLEPLQLLPQMT